MSAWRYEETLNLLSRLEALPANDPAHQRSLEKLTRTVNETQLLWHMTAAILSHGVAIAMGLGRCALAEKEGNPIYWEYWAQVVDDAGAVQAAWDGLLRYGRLTQSSIAELLHSCPVEERVTAVQEMAQAVLEREVRLASRLKGERRSGPIAHPREASAATRG